MFMTANPTDLVARAATTAQSRARNDGEHSPRSIFRARANPSTTPANYPHSRRPVQNPTARKIPPNVAISARPTALSRHSRTFRRPGKPRAKNPWVFLPR
jgi:hypothetical protein